MDEWCERATQQLERGGNRSAVRRAVVEKLAAQPCAVTAVALADELGADGRKVGRATVYRVLERLRELHLVQGLDVGRDGTRYEPVRETGHHHHFVCDRCGRVVPFSDARLEQAIDRVGRGAPFEVLRHDVVLHGVCEACG